MLLDGGHKIVVEHKGTSASRILLDGMELKNVFNYDVKSSESRCTTISIELAPEELVICGTAQKEQAQPGENKEEDEGAQKGG